MIDKQQAILIGIILGDCYLQQTGRTNARIRLEHGIEQKSYLNWKIKQLSHFSWGKVNFLVRYNKIYCKEYKYVRSQSFSSYHLGNMKRLFYDENGKKVIPENIKDFLEPISLAVWFMDDGYYYNRDRIAYIYLPNYREQKF